MGLQTKLAYAALESDGVTPYQHPVELDRNLLEGLNTQSGAMRVGDFALSPTGTNQQLSIAQGSAFVLGQENAQQGGYFSWSDVAELKTFGAPSGSPRIDTLLLRIYDPQYGTLPSGSTRAQWDVVAGTPGATPAARPNSDFLSGGSQYVPGAWMKWAEVRINPGDTVIPSGQIYIPGSVVSGTGTTWGGTYARQAGTPILCLSTNRPASPRTNEVILEADTGRYFRWSGSAWTWPNGRGVVGGSRFTSGNAWNTITTTEAIMTAAGGTFNTGSLTLEKNRRFKIHVRSTGHLGSTTTVLLLKLKETNVAGAQIGEFVQPIDINTGKTVLFEAEHETGGTDETKTYVVTASTVGAGTCSGSAGTTAAPTYVEVEDIGPAGAVVTRAWP